MIYYDENYKLIMYLLYSNQQLKTVVDFEICIWLVDYIIANFDPV